jgi:hypothetical protein
MAMFHISIIATFAVCIGRIIVGILTLRRHKTAARLSIVGWSLFLIITSGQLFFSVSTIANFFLSSFGSMLAFALQVAAYICIFLGIYLLLLRCPSTTITFPVLYATYPA